MKFLENITLIHTKYFSRYTIEHFKSILIMELNFLAEKTTFLLSNDSTIVLKNRMYSLTREQ